MGPSSITALKHFTAHPGVQAIPPPGKGKLKKLILVWLLGSLVHTADCERDPEDKKKEAKESAKELKSSKKQEAKKNAKELKSSKKKEAKKSAKGPPIKKQSAKGRVPMPPGRDHPCLGRLFRTVSLKYQKAYLTFKDKDQKKKLLVEVRGGNLKARHGWPWSFHQS